MRRTLAVSVLVAAVFALAACGGKGSPTATGTTAAAPAPGAATTGPPAAGAKDPACAEVTRTVEDTTTKTQQEIAKAATASEADLQKSLQTVKQLYTDAGASIKTAAGKAVDAEVKAAMENLATEATKVATSLDPSIGPAQALALMDRAKVTAAVQRVQQACGQA